MVIDKKCYIGGQESGWMNIAGFLWYIQAIIKEVNEHRKKFDLENETFLMFTDGHNSRECPEALNLLKQHNIRLEIIPSHCSHLLQPCDLGIFAALKTWISKNRYRYLDTEIIKNIKEGELEEKVSETDEKRLKLVLLILDAVKSTSTELTIKNCFRKSGITPFNIEEPLNNIRCIDSDKSFYDIDTNKKVNSRLNINGKCITDGKLIEEIAKKKKKLILKNKINQKNSRSKRLKGRTP